MTDDCTSTKCDGPSAENFELEVWQDGAPVAMAGGPDREKVISEANHYAAVYGQDGPVEIYEVVRIPFREAAERRKGTSSPYPWANIRWLPGTAS